MGAASLHSSTSLPAPTLELYARLSRGELIERHAALPIARWRLGVRVALAVLLALAVFALWGTLYLDLHGGYKGYADDDDAMISTVLVALLALPGTMAFLGAVSLRRSRLRPALIVGPALLVRTGYDDEPVQATPVATVGGWSVVGARARTRVDGEDVVGSAPDAASARRFVDAAESAAREAAALPSEVRAFDWRKSVGPAGRSFGPFARFLLALAVTAVVTVPLTLVIWLAGFARAEREAWATCREGPYCTDYEQIADFGANDIPGWFYEALGIPERRAEAARQSDDEAWRECQRSTSPAHIRGFLTRENSAHLAEARALLITRYEERSVRLASEATAIGGDPELILGLEEALLWLATDAESDRMSVGFLPVAGLEGGGIESAVAARTGSTHVQPVAPSFTAERNAARERAVRATISLAMAPLAGFASVDSGTEDLTRPRFSIALRVAPGGDVYTDRAEDALPMAERTVYPGIVLMFDCTIVVPGAVTPAHSARIVATPAADFRVEGSGGAVATSDVYDRMAETAFDQLEAAIERALGYTPPPPRWPPWLPEWEAGAYEPAVGGEYVVYDERGGLDSVTGGYRGLLVADGYTVEPFPGALDPEHDWLARRSDHRAHVRLSWDAYEHGSYIRVTDVTEIYP